jgi:spore cortex biosynthesis protein YabQ
MEIYITAQLLSFLSSVLLGTVGGLVYDLLRALRRLRKGSRVLTHLLDSLYILMLGLTLLWFALRVGEGELRLYMVLGVFLGGWLYFLLLSAFLRPLWDFWAGTLAQAVHLLLLPIRFLWRECKKLWGFCKKSFLFHRKYATINKYRWECIHLRSHNGEKGGRTTDASSKKKHKKTE